MCSNCLKYELECEYPPEKNSSQSRGSSPKQFPLKRIVSNDRNPNYLSPYASPTPPKCQCQQLREAGILPPGGCEAQGSASRPDWKSQHLGGSQTLESGSLQPMNTPTDRLLELKLMHRKAYLSFRRSWFHVVAVAFPITLTCNIRDKIYKSIIVQVLNTNSLNPSRFHQIQLRKPIQAHRL